MIPFNCCGISGYITSFCLSESFCLLITNSLPYSSLIVCIKFDPRGSKRMVRVSSGVGAS